MINLLIAEDNLNYSASLINTLNKSNSNIRVYRIAKNGKEAINFLNECNNIDIVLLDLKMPYYSGIEVLEKIENKDKYKNSIIIITGELQFIKDVRISSMINSIIYKMEDRNEIVHKISEAFKYKEKIKMEEKFKARITKEVLSLGYNISYKGTQYLIDTIEIIIQRYNKKACILEKDVYPIISKKYRDSIHNVKCNICRATNNMYYDCEINKLKEYFHLDKDTKPKVKVIINTIISKIL